VLMWLLIGWAALSALFGVAWAAFHIGQRRGADRLADEWLEAEDRGPADPVAHWPAARGREGRPS